MKASGDGAQCVTGGDTSGNLFTLAEARYSRCTTAVQYPLRLAGRVGDAENRLASFLSAPEFFAFSA